MPSNITYAGTSSAGIWQGDNPLDYALPLLIIQITLVLVLSRFLAFLLKPLREPKVVAEIAGGILLGPSALGRYPEFLELVFPPWSTPILDTVANLGVLFYIFLIGVELDLSSISKAARKAFPVAIAGIIPPFFFAAGIAALLHHFPNIVGSGHLSGSYWKTLLFLGTCMSITAFPVLARILAELRLLTTNVGKTAMAAATFNDLAAWILLALVIALTSTNTHSNTLSTLWILLCTLVFLGFMLMIVRPAMTRVAKRVAPDPEDDFWVCFALAGAVLSGFATDFIGIHAIFGAFVFGLSVPKEVDFGGKLAKRIEDFVSVLLLPLYFASSGLKTNVAKIQTPAAWGLLALFITTACTGKILGTFLAALLSKIPPRESLTLGVLMNTKGLVDLIVLNIGRERKILDEEMFTILVLTAVVICFMTSPIVIALNNKQASEVNSWSSSRCEHYHKKESWLIAECLNQQEAKKFRILSCVHRPGDVPSMVNVIELTRGAKNYPLKLYSMHLMELTDRSSSMMMVHRARRNGMPFITRLLKGKLDDQVTIAFEAYTEVSRVQMHSTRAISRLHAMHEDICHVAKRKRINMIILPFHKKWKRGDEGLEMENLGHGWRAVNQRVLQSAPCSIAILVDRGFNYEKNKIFPMRICILFFGEPNDYEALKLGARMSESVLAEVTITRFFQIDKPTSVDDNSIEAAFAEFQQRWGQRVTWKEKIANDVVNQAIQIGQSGEYDLIIVGQGSLSANLRDEQGNHQSEYIELGAIGDALASPNNEVVSSLLIVKSHDQVVVNETQAP